MYLQELWESLTGKFSKYLRRIIMISKKFVNYKCKIAQFNSSSAYFSILLAFTVLV